MLQIENKGEFVIVYIDVTFFFFWQQQMCDYQQLGVFFCTKVATSHQAHFPSEWMETQRKKNLSSVCLLSGISVSAPVAGTLADYSLTPRSMASRSLVTLQVFLSRQTQMLPRSTEYFTSCRDKYCMCYCMQRNALSWWITCFSLFLKQVEIKKIMLPNSLSPKTKIISVYEFNW